MCTNFVPWYFQTGASVGEPITFTGTSSLWEPKFECPAEYQKFMDSVLPRIHPQIDTNIFFTRILVIMLIGGVLFFLLASSNRKHIKEDLNSISKEQEEKLKATKAAYKSGELARKAVQELQASGKLLE
jgi:hypothetical protein